MNEMKSADFSNCEQYRYVLRRIWDESLPRVGFIGLNPSTADHKKDDPTIRRCRNFAKSWGYGGMWMVNLFSYRATKPKDMEKAIEPEGENTNWYLKYTERHCEKMVACWGNGGTFLSRDREVITLLKDLYCITTSKDGHPRHPLYLKKDLKLIPYMRGSK